MFMYTDETDNTTSIRGDFYEGKSLQEMISMLFKGKTSDFLTDVVYGGFSTDVLPKQVKSRVHSLQFFLCPIRPQSLDSISVLARMGEGCAMSSSTA